MNQTSAVPVVASILEVPGARLHYELRGTGPLVLLVGAPMHAAQFAPLADLLAVDHMVLTTDPRGVNRSLVEDPDADSTPQMRADDLARLIAHVGAGRAAVFGSSGGAVSALALAQAHPEHVHTVVAHEPPLIELLDDRERRRELTEDYVATYLSGDVVGAWRKFLAHANIDLPDEAFEQMFAEQRDPQQVADEHFWFAHELRPSAYWRPDVAALRAGPTRIVVGIGADSTGEVCDLTATALAGDLGIEPIVFPGGHIAFVDDPAGFVPRLRAVLDS